MEDLSTKVVRLYCDGASKGNPGPAGIGVVAYMDQKVFFEFSKGIGIQTNNVAEYTALQKGLEILQEKLGKSKNQFKVEIFLDSELIVKQLKGEYKVKNSNLKKIYINIQKLLNEFSHWSIQHIPREKNQRADYLASFSIS